MGVKKWDDSRYAGSPLELVGLRWKKSMGGLIIPQGADKLWFSDMGGAISAVGDVFFQGTGAVSRKVSRGSVYAIGPVVHVGKISPRAPLSQISMGCKTEEPWLPKPKEPIGWNCYETVGILNADAMLREIVQTYVDTPISDEINTEPEVINCKVHGKVETKAGACCLCYEDSMLIGESNV